MKKHHVLGLLMLALLAFSAVMAASASAEITLLAEWLVKEKAIITLTSAEVSGELLLEDTGVKGHVICNGIFDGSVGESGEAEITEVLSLAGAKIELVAGKWLICKSTTGSACEESATDIEVAPDGLPWHGLLFLMENGEMLLVLNSVVTYTVVCLDLGLKITDECTAAAGTSGKIVNSATSAEEKGEATPKANCSLGGKETGVIEPLPGNQVLNLEGVGVFATSEGFPE
jgi:hypothetical protein